MIRPLFVGDRLHAVGDEVATGQHRDHAGHGLRRRDVDRGNARMRRAGERTITA
jgi:hypothetical protein